MKTPKQWLHEFGDGETSFLTEADIAAIQADAIVDHLMASQDALKIIEKVGTTGIEHEHQNAQQWLLRYFPEHA